MIPDSESIVIGLLRASAGLSVAGLAVAACLRLLRVRAPRVEQWAWLLVLAQGVIVFPVVIPVALPPEAPGTALKPEPTRPPFESPRAEQNPERRFSGVKSAEAVVATRVPGAETPTAPAGMVRRSTDLRMP